MNPASKEYNKLPYWIWSSTQSGAANAWNWYSGGWNNYTYRLKLNSLAAVPFFAIKKESALLKTLNYKVVK